MQSYSVMNVNLPKTPNGEQEPLLSRERQTSEDGDVENVRVEGRTSLKRALSARQVQTIALGGTIGTGLFLGMFNMENREKLLTI